MITFIQFLESVGEDANKDAFINHFQLNISDKKGWYANISMFDAKKLQDRMNTWNKYAKMNDADKKMIKDITKSKSTKLIDLFNAFYQKSSQQPEENAPPSPKS
jgi:hypothetical protein